MLRTTSDLVYQTSYILERTRHEFDVIRLWEQPVTLTEIQPSELSLDPIHADAIILLQEFYFRAQFLVLNRLFSSVPGQGTMKIKISTWYAHFIITKSNPYD